MAWLFDNYIFFKNIPQKSYLDIWANPLLSKNHSFYINEIYLHSWAFIVAGLVQMAKERTESWGVLLQVLPYIHHRKGKSIDVVYKSLNLGLRSRCGFLLCTDIMRERNVLD